MTPEKFEPLDAVIHSPVRLAVLSVLASVRRADFAYLKEATETTDGNLSTHLAKLADAGYITVRKSFRGRKPLTSCALTDKGRASFTKYLKALESYFPAPESKKE